MLAVSSKKKKKKKKKKKREKLVKYLGNEAN